MKQYCITEITTKDNIILQGMFYPPSRKATGDAVNTAILWVHGLTSNFYGDVELFEHIITADKTMGFVSFNTRGHDMISGLSRVNTALPGGREHVNGGAGYEKFTDCVYDIDAGITFLVNQGYKTIILAGHSTGANKVCYYAGHTHDKRVSGVILAAPMSDRLMEEKTNPKLPLHLRQMQQMVRKKKDHYLVNNLSFFPMTPERFLSLFKKGSVEDVFDYGDKNPKLTFFHKIKQPLLVVLSGADEYADRPAGDIQKVFDDHTTSKLYSSVIIKDATHGYDGKETEFAKIIVEWINKSLRGTK